MPLLTKNVCHITTAHPRYDIRIYQKECQSLSKFYNVFLIVADGKGNELINGIQIIDVSTGNKSRIKRIFWSTRMAYKAAIELDCEIYHFHDPELLMCGLLLRKKGKKVFYDVHEDLPKQIMSKSYLNPIFRKFLSRLIGRVEDFAAPRLSGIITVTKSIYARFSAFNDQCFIINNYPK